jgi:type IV pilus assembly protein PilO
MPDLRETRRKLKIALGAMVAVDIVAVAIMVSPLVGSTASRKQQLSQLWLQLQAKTRQVEPLRGLDQKIPLANQQIDQFYKERFPSHDSEVAEAMGALAKQSGVKVDGAKYEWGDPDPIGLRRVDIETSVEGNYQALAKFLNGLERDKIFFIVNSVGLAAQNGPVVLQMKLETYQKVSS